jgi:hypothetical protein
VFGDCACTSFQTGFKQLQTKPYTAHSIFDTFQRMAFILTMVNEELSYKAIILQVLFTFNSYQEMKIIENL